MANGTAKEEVERVFFEHISFLYKHVLLGAVIFIVGVAAAVVFNMWFIALGGLLVGILPAYLKKKQRNRFLLTNRRFIRELYNPHRSVIAVPLSEIRGAKIMNRATDKFGTVQILTTPAYGEQLLVDGEREYGIIICRKVPGHAGFRDIVAFAAEVAVKES